MSEQAVLVVASDVIAMLFDKHVCIYIDGRNVYMPAITV
jgi:hypothetical protein